MSSSPSTMKEVITHPGLRCEIITSPIPTPGPDQVVIRVIVTASNPKDHKYWILNRTMNTGDDMAGFVHAVGSNVHEFRPGDRVFAFHQIASDHGAYAEYAVAPATTTYHLHPKVAFHEAATVPLAAFTAAWTLFRQLRLPEPWTPRSDGEQRPLLVYGASGAVGAFAVKLARAANIHPIVAVAGKGSAYVETLIDASRGDVVLDYRDGMDALHKKMLATLAASIPDGDTAGLFTSAFDAVATAETVSFCARVVRQGGDFVQVMPLDGEGHKDAFRKEVNFDVSAVPMVNGAFGVELPGALDFGYIWMRAFARGLAEGWLTGHPYEVIEGGLEGIQEGLERLSRGEASAVKYAYEVGTV